MSSTSLGGKEPRRRARGLAPSGLRASGRGEGGSAGTADRGGGRLQLQRRRSRHGPSPPVPRRALPAPAPPRRSLASSAPAPPRAAGGGTERGGAALRTPAATGSGTRLPALEAGARPVPIHCAQSGSPLSASRARLAQSKSTFPVPGASLGAQCEPSAPDRLRPAIPRSCPAPGPALGFARSGVASFPAPTPSVTWVSFS